MDESGIVQNRRSRRAPVLLAATLEAEGSSTPVKLRNLSEEGALVEGDGLPAEGSAVHFLRKDLRLTSRLVWVQGRFAGVAFDERLNPEQVLRHIPKPRPQMPKDFKRPGLACRPLSPHERRMLETWMTASPVGSVGE
jgi:hypothetical protein